MPTEIMTDEQIIAKHSPNVRARARLELQIVNKLIETANAAGYILKVEEHNDDDGLFYDVKTELFDLDEANVRVYAADGTYLGWVYLVFGNDGYDLISNYTVGLQDFLAPVNALADSLA